MFASKVIIRTRFSQNLNMLAKVAVVAVRSRKDVMNIWVFCVVKINVLKNPKLTKFWKI